SVERFELEQTDQSHSTTAARPAPVPIGSTGLPSRSSAESPWVDCGNVGAARKQPKHKAAAEIIRSGINRALYISLGAPCRRFVFYTRRRLSRSGLCGRFLLTVWSIESALRSDT